MLLLQLKKYLFLVLLFTTSLSFAGIIKGKVTDAKTGEPLIGAMVQLEKGDKKYTTMVNLDGSYTFRNIPAGKYELKVKFAGYEKSKEADITLKNETDVVVFNNSLAAETKDLEQITVKTGGNRETDNAVRLSEKNADIVQNIMSQKAIELSPDVTVANSLQRMSGVTIEKSSSGEGRYAIIRGMDQRYNNTLVNGIKIPSPDDKFRYVPMDLFPSDLLERLEVIKTLTPSMEADVIGGSMNLVMKNAPHKFILNVHAAGGLNILFNDRDFSTFDHSVINKKDPIATNGSGYLPSDADFSRKNVNFYRQTDPINFQSGLTIGNRFFKKRLGFILGVSFQNMFRGSNSTFNKLNAQPALETYNGVAYDNRPVFDDGFVRQYSTKQTRVALNNKWDYIFNENNKISLFNLYIHMDEFQSRYSIDSSLTTQRTGPGSGNVAVYNRSRWQIQDIYNSTLQGEHNLSKLLTFKWSAVYSIAKQNIPDQAEYEVDNEVKNNVVTTPPGYVLKSMKRLWKNNSDQDKAIYANFIYTPTIANKKVELSAGGLFRHKNRDNYYNEFSLSAKGTQQTFTNINDAVYEFKNVTEAKGNPLNPNIYTSIEEITAGYIQAKFMASKKLQVLGGVRVEYTNQNYNTVMPETFDAKYGKISYTDVLPSIHLKYTLSKNENIRASYFASISRPGFYEITPYQDFQTESYLQQGNPYLKHTTANNFDVRYELFPNGADQILIGGFYKSIGNPIELGFERIGTGTLILTPKNFGTATNYGVELVVTKFFGKFGVNANYTYTKSEITTDKFYRYYNATTNAADTKTVQQTRPMQGQANNIGNVSLLFKDSKNIGLDVQLAFVYSGERIVQVSNYADNDYWQQPTAQLDFSFEKKLAKHVSLYTKINNLTNAKTNVIVKKPYYANGLPNQLPGQDDFSHINVQRDENKLSYLFGVRYKF
ncbi:MAG: TonB-dependent receptor [Pedobacter sp.]|nr:TonB-dependent receptor [Chitinophagaceae bacterium]